MERLSRMLQAAQGMGLSGGGPGGVSDPFSPSSWIQSWKTLFAFIVQNTGFTIVIHLGILLFLLYIIYIAMTEANRDFIQGLAQPH